MSDEVVTNADDGRGIVRGEHYDVDVFGFEGYRQITVRAGQRSVERIVPSASARKGGRCGCGSTAPKSSFQRSEQRC